MENTILAKIMKAVAKVFGPLLKIMNIGAGIVAAIWLIGLHKEVIVGLGLLLIFSSHWPLGLVIMFGIVFAGPAMYFYEQRKVLASRVFASLSLLYTFALMSAWFLITLYLALKLADANSAAPMLIGSFTVASAPWSFMAQKDDNEMSIITLAHAQIGMILSIALLLVGAPFFCAIIALALPMLLAYIFELSHIFAEMKEDPRRYNNSETISHHGIIADGYERTRERLPVRPGKGGNDEVNKKENRLLPKVTPAPSCKTDDGRMSPADYVPDLSELRNDNKKN